MGKLRDIPEEWARFLMEGEWVLGIPQVEGTYPVATRQGEPAGEIVVYVDPTTGQHVPTKSWGGFFWSLPLPSLPTVPISMLGDVTSDRPPSENHCQCGAFAPIGWSECLSCRARSRFRK